MACFFASPGQQQRLPGARFAFDEQDLALALLHAVQQAEDRLELLPASPHRAGPVWSTPVGHGIPRQLRHHDPPGLGPRGISGEAVSRTEGGSVHTIACGCHRMPRLPRPGRPVNAARSPHPVRPVKSNWAEPSVAIRSTARTPCAPVSSMIPRTARETAISRMNPPRSSARRRVVRKRPQVGAVHERDAGHVEQEPRAVLAHDPQQSLLQRGLRANVQFSADHHDGAVVAGADTQRQTHNPTLTAPILN